MKIRTRRGKGVALPLTPLREVKSMPFGFLGKILRVDLTSRSISVEEMGEEFYRTYMGGYGFGGYYLLREMKKGVDPYSPDNVLVFATGVLTGVPISGMCRYTVCAKSPLTGCFGESDSAGYFGPELKRAGFDAIVITGRSEKPVYLYIEGGKAEIRDASGIWGLETKEAYNRIKEETPKGTRVALIGPAGERGIRYSCITNELRHYNGRNGLGAVMGSKNLKAIAVCGSGSIPLHNPEGIKSVVKRFEELKKDHPITKTLYEFGTSATVLVNNAGGILPTKNFRMGAFDGAERISGKAMNESILVGRENCYACTVRCKRVVSVPELGVSPEYGGPEYETIAAMGSLCLIDDIKVVALANQLCNAYGLDTISTGVAIAFAMECYENGIISKSDTDGIELTFGNKDALIAMIHKIAKKEGFGAVLAEGAARAAKVIGRGADKFAIAVKGQEVPLHEPRGKYMIGLGYAVCEHGADHMTVGHDTMLSSKEQYTFKGIAPFGILEPTSPVKFVPEKIRTYSYLYAWWNFFDCAGICKFVVVPRSVMPVNMVVEALGYATGWETSLFEVLKVGERASVLARLYNLREGIDAKEDRLPERFFEPLENGPLAGQKMDKEEFEKAKLLYYDMMGWNERGVPKESKLYELGLGWAVPVLKEI